MNFNGHGPSSPGSSDSRNPNGKDGVRKKRRRLTQRRKRALDPGVTIDYKNPDLIKRFITERGKIIPRRISGATQAQQRQIAVAVKRARFLALIPSTATHRVERGFAGRIQTIMQTFTSASARQRPRYERNDRGASGENDRAERSEQKFTSQDKPSDSNHETNK